MDNTTKTKQKTTKTAKKSEKGRSQQDQKGSPLISSEDEFEDVMNAEDEESSIAFLKAGGETLGENGKKTEESLNSSHLLALKQLWEEEDRQRELESKFWKDFTITVQSAAQSQPNISRSVKDKIPQLEEFFKQQDENRKALTASRKTVLAQMTEMAQAYQQMSEQIRKVSFQIRPGSRGSKRGKNGDSSSEAGTPVKYAKTNAATSTASASTKQKQENDGFQKVLTRSQRKRENREKSKADASSNHVTENCLEKETESCQQTANPKRKRRRKKIKSRTEAIIIKPVNGKSYAEVLGMIKTEVRPEETETIVRKVRKTREGGVLLELDRKSKNTSSFAESLRNTLGDPNLVQDRQPHMTLEIRDLSEDETETTVKEALHRDLNSLNGVRKVFVSSSNQRGQKLAKIIVHQEVANTLLKMEKIRIGWINCRIRVKTRVIRCFKCLDFGHRTWDCKGPDRRDACLICGEVGHKAAECQHRDQDCYLCKECNVEEKKIRHIPGTGRCTAFQIALKRLTQKQRN